MIKPFGNRILVKPIEAEKKRRSGIIIATDIKGKSSKGEIVAVGCGDEVKFLPKGAQVVYSTYAGTTVDFDNLDLKILSDKDILGVITADED